MPNVAQLRPYRAARTEPLFLFDARRPQVAADAAMLAKVITHADDCVRMAGGRMKLRVTRPMVERLIADGKLAAADWRIADLTVIWDETEGQVATVRDDARMRDAASRWAEWDALWDADSYEGDDGYVSAAA